MNSDAMVIETHDLTRRFGSCVAVNRMNLKVPRGASMALLGPNGAGKTTTVKLLLHMLRPSAGEARVFGMPSERLGAAEFARIGFVSEEQALPDWMTVRQLLAYLQPLYPGWDKELGRELLRKFELPLDQRLRHLSRGARMKAMLAAALIYRPDMLVLDEPFGGLDPLVREELIAGMLEVASEQNVSMLISSHDIDDVERLVDWAAFMDQGELRQIAPVEELLRKWRRIELTLAQGADSISEWPSGWLQGSVAGRMVRFLDSNYDASTAEQASKQRWPQMIRFDSYPMSLKEIYLALAQQWRQNRAV
jgi:ABC-2 type transport system ATP-binding protein